MGRNKHKKGKGKGGKSGNGGWDQDAPANKRPRKEGEEGESGPRPDADGYTNFVRENLVFERYYKLQGILPEGEWGEFIAHLRRPLPTTFRITGTRG